MIGDRLKTNIKTRVSMKISFSILEVSVRKSIVDLGRRFVMNID